MRKDNRFAGICHWCNRGMVDKRNTRHRLARTKDHVWPESLTYKAPAHLRGKTVPACRGCNIVKADLLPLAWMHFRLANPRWWNLMDRVSRSRSTETTVTTRMGRLYAQARHMAGHCRQEGCGRDG